MTKNKLLRDKLHMQHRRRVRRWRKYHTSEVYRLGTDKKYHWVEKEEVKQKKTLQKKKIGKQEALPKYFENV